MDAGKACLGRVARRRYTGGDMASETRRFQITNHHSYAFNTFSVKSIRLPGHYFFVIYQQQQFQVSVSSFVQIVQRLFPFFSLIFSIYLSVRKNTSSASVHWFFVGSFAWGWLAGVVGGFGVDGWSDGSSNVSL